MSGSETPAAAPPSSLLETERRWAALLAGIGGFVDAAGFLVIFGLFTAQMSGNSTGLCVALATGDWLEAARRGFVIPVFLLATAAGAAWIEVRSPHASTVTGRNRAIAGVLTAEAAMLIVFMLVAVWIGQPISLTAHPLGFFLGAASATVAMGLQNAALRRVHTQVVHTTFVTGMMTSLAVALVQWALGARKARTDPAIRERVHHARVNAAVSLLIWSSYVAGAFLGAWLVSRHGAWMVGVPTTALVGLVGVLCRPGTVPPGVPVL